MHLPYAPRRLALALAFGLALPAAAQPQHREDYIVTFTESGILHYRGEVPGYAATGGRRLQAGAAEVQAYTAWLAGRRAAHLAAMEQALGRAVPASHSYAVLRNGVAAALTPDEAARIARLPGVAGVRVGGTSRLATYRGPAFIGAETAWNSGLPAARGQGQVIGIIDSGSAAAHPSFADDTSCGFNSAAPKLLSARDCGSAADGVCNGPSPEANDNNGHGVHVAATAAGNTLDALSTIPAPSVPAPYTQVSGVAPCAQVRSYKVCETNLCSNIAMEAALENAILDGVDVINLSISGGLSPWEDYDRSLLEAVGQDIVVVAAAGNTGVVANPVGQVNHLGPWITTVAAITHDRNAVGNGVLAVHGPGTPPPALQSIAIYPSNSPDLGAGLGQRALRFDSGNIDGCAPFAAGALQGTLALMQRGNCNFSVKLHNSQTAGASGALVYNNEAGIITMDVGAETLPGYSLSAADGEALLQFITASTPAEPLASLTPAQRRGDVLADFSLRGPVPAWLDAGKPDIAAPGVAIYAASDAASDNYQSLSGTSMATPHVAGAMALLRARHPSWSASEISSALISTANPTGLRENLQSAWTSEDVGSGRAAVDRALAAGLTLQESYANFVAADPAEGGNVAQLNLPALRELDCTAECSFTRTVTSRLAGSALWQADYVAESGQIGVSISPASFRLDPGQSQVLTLRFTPPPGVAMARPAAGAVRLREAGGAAPEQRLRSLVQGVGSYVYLSAASADIQVEDHCISHPQQSNGIAEPGERLILRVPVQANGEAFTQVQARLLPPWPAGVRVLRGSDHLGNIALGANAEAQFELELTSGAACLATLDLQAQLSSNSRSFTQSLPLRIGQEFPRPAGLPRDIPDGDLAGISSSIDVSESGNLQSLAVRVAVEHGWVGDLRLQLTSPAGITVTLLDRPGVPASAFGCGNHDLVLRFADNAADAESRCAAGNGQPWPVSDAAPAQPLSAFAGQPLQGRWTLTVSDAAGGYRGRVVDWSLQPQPAFGVQCSACQDRPESIFADGYDLP